MNDRQRAVVDAAVNDVMDLLRQPVTRDEVEAMLYQLALGLLRPQARAGDAEPTRRTPAAGEVLPAGQRASWARARTEYDE